MGKRVAWIAIWRKSLGAIWRSRELGSHSTHIRLILSAIETPVVVQESTEERPAEQPTTEDSTDAALAEVA